VRRREKGLSSGAALMVGPACPASYLVQTSSGKHPEAGGAVNLAKGAAPTQRSDAQTRGQREGREKER
jgi:hypothetical protein